MPSSELSVAAEADRRGAVRVDWRDSPLVWVEKQRTAGHERSGGGPSAERVVDLGQLSASLRAFPFASCAQRMGLRHRHIGACLALALGAALADGAMLALLVPLGKGVGTGSFASFWSVPLVHHLIPEPQSFAAGFLLLASLMFALAWIPMATP